MQRRLPLVSAGDARRHFAGERILAAPPPLFLLHQPTDAAEAEFLRAQDRGRTDLVLGNPFEDVEPEPDL